MRISKKLNVALCAILLGVPLTASCYVQDNEYADEKLRAISQHDGIRIEISYFRWSRSVTPAPDLQSIDERADITTRVNNDVVSQALIGQIRHSLGSCDENENDDLQDTRLKITVIDSDEKILGVLLSDGDILIDQSGKRLGCMTNKLRFLFGLGDPGLFGYAEFDALLRGELNKDVGSSN